MSFFNFNMLSRAHCISTLVNSNSLPCPSQFFQNSTAKKLDDSNNLSWKQQFDTVTNAHRLYCFVVKLVIHPRFHIEDWESRTINPVYEEREIPDQVLLAWLQSTLSKNIQSLVLGVVHSSQAWEHSYDPFPTQSKAPTCQLCTNLQAQLLVNKSVREFMGHIKSLVHELASIGYPLKPDEYIDAILEDLLQEYAAVTFVTKSKFKTP